MIRWYESVTFILWVYKQGNVNKADFSERSALYQLQY